MSITLTFDSPNVGSDSLQRAFDEASGHAVDLSRVIVQDLLIEDYCCVGPNAVRLSFDGELGKAVNRAWSADGRFFHLLMPFTQARPSAYRAKMPPRVAPAKPDELIMPYEKYLTRLENDRVRVREDAPFIHRLAGEVVLTLDEVTSIIHQHVIHDNVVDLSGGISANLPEHARVVISLVCLPLKAKPKEPIVPEALSVSPLESPDVSDRDEPSKPNLSDDGRSD